MPAYVIVDVQVSDAATYEKYKQAVLPTIEAFGGRFVVRGGAIESLEGDWRPERLVVIEFDAAERARAWWDSDAYRGPKALRRSASTANIVLVEGGPAQ